MIPVSRPSAYKIAVPLIMTSNSHGISKIWSKVCFTMCVTTQNNIVFHMVIQNTT